MNSDDRIVYRKACRSCGGTGGTRRETNSGWEGVPCVHCKGQGYTVEDVTLDVLVEAVVERIGGSTAEKIEEVLTYEVRELLEECRDEMTRFLQQVPGAFTAHSRKKMGDRLSRINSVLLRLG